MRLQTLLTFGMLSAVALAQQPAPTQPPNAPQAAPAAPTAIVAPNTVVLTIGSEKITRAEFEQLLAAIAASGRPTPTPPQRRQMAQQLGELKALAQEARKRKLDQAPETKQLVALQVDQVLAGMLARDLNSQIKVDDAALHSYFDSHKGEYEQVKARHILIRFKGSQVQLKPNQKDLTEEEALAKAQEIRKQLVGGADFATIAKAESDDPGSGAAGGSLGSFPRGQMVAPFDQAVFSLPVGQISEPVKTPFGYHIIKVEEHGNKTFEEARPEIEGKLKPQLAREAIERIQKQGSVTLDEAYFGK